MRHPRARRLPAALGATVLTAALLTGCTAPGTGAAPAASPPPPAAPPSPAASPSPASPGTSAPASAPAPAPAPGQAAARRELRALEASFGGRIGAYALDTGTGAAVSHRADERFPLLSTFKAVAAAAVLHRARTAEPGLMEERVRWTAADLQAHSPVTGEHVQDGLTVAELCEAAITQSDNTAANLLLARIGGPAGLTRYLRALGDTVSRLDRREPGLNDWRPGERRDTTTPAAIAGTLRALAVGDALHPRDRERLNGWLRANRTGDARIRAGLPKDWTVGDKTGTGGTYGTANDVAVVRPAGDAAPIVMAVYTNRRSAGAARDDRVVAETAAVLARALGRLPRAVSSP
ncbi:PEN family class A beta-lactamase, Bpc-type [Planomonospora alba]|uniref:Beta-lactamase n=1 Tax=Planomonospora alba TaxID=161354 RepID=A0ABP6NK67_9ACTN